MRPTKEILTLVRDEFIEQSAPAGLCWVAFDLYNQRVLTNEEEHFFSGFIRKNKPIKGDDTYLDPEEYEFSSIYFWPKYNKTLRIEWLNSQINLQD